MELIDLLENIVKSSYCICELLYDGDLVEAVSCAYEQRKKIESQIDERVQIIAMLPSHLHHLTALLPAF